MKILRFPILASLVAAAMMSSCGSDDDEQIFVTCPTSLTQIVLTETKTSDVQSIEQTQSYSYSSGMLLGAETRQSYRNSIFSGGETEELIYATNVERGDNSVVMTDSYGNVSTYSLNSYGIAESCVRSEAGGSVRTYQFDYVIISNRPMLTSVTESIDGEEFSSIDITYSGNDVMHVVRKISGETLAYTVDMSGSGVVQNDYLLPSLFLAEMHPLSLHLPALYGCLLGYPTTLLGGTITPDDNLYNEKSTYSYTADDNGRPTKCVVNLVSDGSTYDTRTINVKVN